MNAAEVRAGPYLQNHLKQLIDGLDRLLFERKAALELNLGEQNRETVQKKYINTIGMEFVLIPEGIFMMGSHFSAKETDRKYGSGVELHNCEHPQFNVKINGTFYLQTTQLTVGQWRKFIKETRYKTEAENGGGAYIVDGSKWKKNKRAYWDNPGFSQDDQHPLTCVSWNDAMELIQWLNHIEGNNKYRLPSESEWEYVCRAGTTTDFSFGDDASQLGEYCWYNKNSGQQTHAVGIMRPNAWNFFDMHGNVWEWVEDDWHFDYNGAPDDGLPWIDKPRGALRVIRGGSWRRSAQDCRSVDRGSSYPDHCSSDVGLRLARSVAFGP